MMRQSMRWRSYGGGSIEPGIGKIPGYVTGRTPWVGLPASLTYSWYPVVTRQDAIYSTTPVRCENGYVGLCMVIGYTEPEGAYRDAYTGEIFNLPLGFMPGGILCAIYNGDVVEDADEIRNREAPNVIAAMKEQLDDLLRDTGYNAEMPVDIPAVNTGTTFQYRINGWASFLDDNDKGGDDGNTDVSGYLTSANWAVCATGYNPIESIGEFRPAPSYSGHNHLTDIKTSDWLISNPRYYVDPATYNGYVDSEKAFFNLIQGVIPFRETIPAGYPYSFPGDWNNYYPIVEWSFGFERPPMFGTKNGNTLLFGNAVSYVMTGRQEVMTYYSRFGAKECMTMCSPIPYLLQDVLKERMFVINEF